MTIEPLNDIVNAPIKDATFIPAPPGLIVDLEGRRARDSVIYGATVVAFRVDGDKLVPYVFHPVKDDNGAEYMAVTSDHRIWRLTPP